MNLSMARISPVVSLSADDLAQLVRWESAPSTPQQVAGIQTFENGLIHLLDGLERTVAVTKDFVVSEVKIGSEPGIRQTVG